MPGYNYLNRGGDAEALGQMGDTSSSIAMALPQMQMNVQRYRQQLALQKATEILRELQQKETSARTGLIGAQTQEAQARTGRIAQQFDQSKSMQDRAGVLGKGMQLQQLFGAGPQNDPNVQAALASIRAVNEGLAAQQAAQTATAAAQLLMPHTLAPGATGVNAF